MRVESPFEGAPGAVEDPDAASAAGGISDQALRAELAAVRSELAAHRAEARAARGDILRHVSVQFHLMRADLRTIAERISALSIRLDHLPR